MANELAGQAPEGPSLDHRTQLVGAIYPDACEAVAYVRPPNRQRPEWLKDLDPAADEDQEPLRGSQSGQEVDPEANWRRSVSRATVRSRRYIVANRLRYMWVFTRGSGCGLHGPIGRALLMKLFAQFVRALRTHLGKDFAYWYSPELHLAAHGQSREVCPIPEQCGCSGHGWHMNFFIAGRVNHEDMKRLWLATDVGNGYELRYSDWTRNNKLAGLPFIEKLRLGAIYGCKYAAKDWSEQNLANGAHKYECAQGFQPIRLEVTAATRDEIEQEISQLAGQTVQHVWTSTDALDWTGPHCWIYRWSPPSPKNPMKSASIAPPGQQ